MHLVLSKHQQNREQQITVACIPNREKKLKWLNFYLKINQLCGIQNKPTTPKPQRKLKVEKPKLQIHAL